MKMPFTTFQSIERERLSIPDSIWAQGYQPADILPRDSSSAEPRGLLMLVDTFEINNSWPLTPRQEVLSKLKNAYHKEQRIIIIAAGWETASVLAQPKIRAISEMVEDIRSAFGISISNIAKLLGASRPRIYSWLDGEVPNQQFSSRINDVAQLAYKWLDFNPYDYPPEKLLMQKIANGPSVFERLCGDLPDDVQIERIFKELETLMTRQYIRMEEVRQRNDRARRVGMRTDLPEGLIGTVHSAD